jgi:beta-lactamase superfamily II metal-dependent hydrolase
MKRLFVIVLIVTAAISLSAQTRSYLPEWQDGYMDIHLIATGRGESTFIILPDGTKMLIDAGDVGDVWSCPLLPNSSKTAGEWISAYVDNFSKGTPGGSNVDYVLLTHFHTDHMGTKINMQVGSDGYGLSGITMVGENTSLGKIVDRGWPDYNFPSAQAVYDASKGFIEEYLKFVQKKGIPCEKFDVGSHIQFVMINNPEKYSNRFRIVNLGGNGQVWTGTAGMSRKVYVGDPDRLEENALSCAIRIEYGSFRYYTGGDITGGWWKFTPEENPKERDFETAIAEVCGPVTVAKVNHHGWYDSANSYFIETLRPQAWLISSSDKSQPAYYTVRRLRDNLIYSDWRDLFCTSAAAEVVTPKIRERMTSIGNIVVRVYESGEKYQIFVMQNDDPTYPLIYRSPIKELK